MEVVFNKKQALGLEKLNEFITQNEHKIFYLLGYAGTGKTFLIGYFIRKILMEYKKKKIYICAPTHQALKIIESCVSANVDNRSEEINKTIYFTTIHKFLEFKPIIDNINGTKKFTSKNNMQKNYNENVFVIIDECSMISQEMANKLDIFITSNKIKIIFMGDNKQLPPVGELESMIFTTIPENYEYYVLLDKIMRTSSIDIKDVCTIIREWDQKIYLPELLLPIHNKKNKNFQMYHKRSDYQKTSWFKFFINELNKGNAPIILTWKNVTANNYNNIIRKKIHGENSNITDTFIAGDHVIFNNFYSDNDITFYTADVVKITKIFTEPLIFYNWQALKIKNIKDHKDVFFNNTIKKLDNVKKKCNADILSIEKIYSEINPEAEKKIIQIKSINRNSINDYNEMLDHMKNIIGIFYKKTSAEEFTKVLWDVYYQNFVNIFAELKFGYSLTTHKAQGSTFNTVLVDLSDIFENQNRIEMQKALYTATSRASKKLRFLVD